MPTAQKIFHKYAGTVWQALIAILCGWATPALAGDEPAEAPAPGISLAAVYTGESLHALRGGVATGSAYLDNLDLQAKLDGSAWGHPGVSAYVYVLYNNGTEFAGPYVGNIQGVSNIEAVPATRLYEAWVELPAPGGGSLRGGLYNLNSEFDVNDAGALFISPEHGIGTELSHTGVTGPSIFPVAGLGLRYRREWQDWTLQAAVIDAVPGDPNDLRRTYVHLGDGSFVIGEVGHAHGDLKLAAGAWRYSLELPDLVATDAQGDPLQRSGSSGAYALANYSFWNEEASGRDLSGFVRFGVADQRVYQVREYLGLGVVATGPWASRPKDRVGLAVGIASNGRPYRDAADAAGTPVDGSEVHFELSYRALLNERVFVQPTLHYIVNPGTDPSLEDAWVAGLRFQAAAWYER